jgi:hypothetical protein
VERLTVVSSDIQVARHARAMGADVAMSDLFLASAMGPRAAGGVTDESTAAEKPTTLSRKELEEWAEMFKRRAKKPAGEGPAGEGSAGEE